ncbi:MAG TPA: hypothetical protein VHD38_03065 [Candidatus Paceibacterota bacterium]|jgi:hypothetical protein|nr:hypothetical protein [Candidatus Paceibacterota bacterium]
MTQQELLAQMESLVEKNDNEALERFVIDHFSDLPRETQGVIAAEFLTQALEREHADSAIVDLQAEGMEALRALKRSGQEN